MYAFVNRGFPAGPLLVLHGQLPSTPATGTSVPTMETGQMRYWSICQNSTYSTDVSGCLSDSDIPVNASGYYTIVSSLGLPQELLVEFDEWLGVAGAAGSPR